MAWLYSIRTPDSCLSCADLLFRCLASKKECVSRTGPRRRRPNKSTLQVQSTLTQDTLTNKPKPRQHPPPSPKALLNIHNPHPPKSHPSAILPNRPPLRPRHLSRLPLPPIPPFNLSNTILSSNIIHIAILILHLPLRNPLQPIHHYLRRHHRRRPHPSNIQHFLRRVPPHHLSLHARLLPRHHPPRRYNRAGPRAEQAVCAARHPGRCFGIKKRAGAQPVRRGVSQGVCAQGRGGRGEESGAAAGDFDILLMVCGLAGVVDGLELTV